MTDSKTLMPRLSHMAAALPEDVLGPILAAGSDPEFISFGGGLPCPEGFPVEAIIEAGEKSLRENAFRALQYSGPQGEIELRRAVAEYETRDRGTPTDPDEVLITSGSQQALDLCARVLCDKGSKILVQRPTYIGALGAFSLSEPTYVEFPENEQGLDAEAIGAEADGARFAYVLTSFSNPTGKTLDEASRRKLVEKAREHDFWIVEDDPYGELWYHEKTPKTVRSMAPERTIRLSSFSKILSPGMRLGYIVAPKELIQVFSKVQSDAVLSTPCINQLIAARVMTSGLFKTHLPHIRGIYREHAEAMLGALEELMPKHPEIYWTRPAGGMFIWLHLPEGFDTFKMMDEAVRRKVLYIPGEFFYAQNPDKNCIRLAFVTVPKDRMRVGVERLASLVKAELERLGK